MYSNDLLKNIGKVWELPMMEKACVQKAIEYVDYSYSPYSNFKVGACVMMEDGSVYGGANEENASYPLCLCAERVALHHASMRDRSQHMVAIAITAKHESKKLIDPAMPCGACRQVILEYEYRNGNKPIKILLINDDEDVFMLESIKALLPHSFKGETLIEK